jgi:hypothetical protein
MAGNHIDELARIEFRDSLGLAFLDYGEALQELGRMWKYELELAAGDSQAAMGALRGHPLLFGIDARVKARLVARRVKRMQEMAHGIEDAGRKFHAAYRSHFLDQAQEPDEIDDEIDDDTKDTLSAIARDSTFLLAVEDYLRRTLILH